MKFYRSKFFIICVAAAIVLVLVPSALSLFGYTDLVRGALKTAATPFEWCGTKVANAVSGFVEVFTEYDELKAENQRLRERIEELESAGHDSDVIREENAWLKTYLQLKQKHSELTMTDAMIVSRESGNYATVLTLNRGSSNGVKVKMPVITADGVFGYVSEVGFDWCKVVSLVETASAVSAYTERGNVVGAVEGDTLLRTEGTCRMIHIAADADIKVGDKVYTAAEGKIYPNGLLIGSIVSIEADEYSKELVAKIQPAVNFSDISSTTQVMILTGYASGGESK